MSNRVVHFEIPSDNPEKAIKFFKEVFGWTFQQYGTMDYWMIETGDEKCPGINGALLKNTEPRLPLTNAIDVENIEKAIEKIEKEGGKIAVQKTPVPAVGWVAYFTDPDGNLHSLFQQDETAV